jgi:hypothetical protein
MSATKTVRALFKRERGPIVIEQRYLKGELYLLKKSASGYAWWTAPSRGSIQTSRTWDTVEQADINFGDWHNV